MFSLDSRVALVTGSFNVPANALSGSTTMRVSMKYHKAASACEVFTYGEVEDYTVNISGSNSALPLANNKTISDFKTKLYPNPANQFTTLELVSDDYSEAAYKVVDLQGRIYIEKDQIKLNGYHEEIIDISKMKPGIYFIIITNDSYKENHKLIIN